MLLSNMSAPKTESQEFNLCRVSQSLPRRFLSILNLSILSRVADSGHSMITKPKFDEDDAQCQPRHWIIYNIQHVHRVLFFFICLGFNLIVKRSFAPRTAREVPVVGTTALAVRGAKEQQCTNCSGSLIITFSQTSDPR